MHTLVIALALSSLAACSRATAPRAGNPYASLAQLPDWSGAWVIPIQEYGLGEMRDHNPQDPRAPLFVGPYATALAAWNFRQLTGKDPRGVKPARSNSEQCLPEGMPSVMRSPLAIEFLFTPGRVTILTEDGPSIRRIYTDGRPHAGDAAATYSGDSVGHWKGDTLVVDTTAISAKAQFIAGVNTSGQTHVIEHIRRTDAKHLQIDTVVEDPIALAKPWRYSTTYERYAPALLDYECAGNDRDANGPNLAPPD